jgi:cellulose biosynthesis protein BcsQ
LANQHACDVVVIDLPTAPRPLINLGLFAASRVIHVLDAHLFAVKKTQALRQAIADAIAKGHPLPQHEAVVANKINTARRRDRQLLERLPEWFNCQAFTLRQEEAMARATQDGIPPLDMAPTGAGSDVLRRLAAWAIEPTQQQQSLSA